jgi:hypothetical protein
LSDLFDIARSLDLSATEPYLRASGWELTRQGDFANGWRLRTPDRVRNIAVPLIDRLDPDDRARMLVSVLDVLIEVEQRSARRIAQDLSDASHDLLEFRLIGDELLRGEMPLRAAPELTKGALDAITAAGRAEVARRPHFAQGTLPAQVRDLVDRAVLAGTDEGSVILRVRAPAAAAPAQETFPSFHRVPGFERRAVQRLVSAVRATKTATHRDPTGDLDLLDQDVEDGLSANLCDAILGLSGAVSRLDATVELRVRWALTDPTDEPATVVDVDHGEIAQLPRIAQVLRGIAPIPNQTVRGYVVQSRRKPGEPTGVINLDAELDGKVRVVKVELDVDDWLVAHDVFGAGGELEVTGTLERAGVVREITAPTGVRAV